MSYQTDLPCAACATIMRQRTFHHVYTRKSRPDLSEFSRNKMPLCLEHHNLIHAQGTTYMSNKFLGVRVWLEKNGWYFCSFQKKWRLEERI